MGAFSNETLRRILGSLTSEDGGIADPDTDNHLLRKILAALVEIGESDSASLPIGVILDYTGDADHESPPDGWLYCDGQAVSRETYSVLFAVIGSTFGNGDGATTFNLPDLRGRVTAGVNDDSGGTGDRLAIEGPNRAEFDAASTEVGAIGGAAAHALIGTELATTAVDMDGGSTYPTVTAEDVGQPHNNVQPTILLNKIIKFR